MSRMEIILIIFFIVIIVAYLTFISFIIYKMQLGAIKKRKSKAIASEPIELNSYYQTDFFNKSAEYAKDVLYGKEIVPEYGESYYYGNKLLDVIKKLNEETKKSVIIAIKYMCIEPESCRKNEKSLRMLAETERMPLWFLILQEAVKKAVPEFNSRPEENIMNNSPVIVPLYQKTG